MSNKNLIFLLILLWGMIGVFKWVIPTCDSFSDLAKIGALPKYELYDGNICTYIVIGIKSVFLHTSIVHLVGNIWLITTGICALMSKNNVLLNGGVFFIGAVLGNLTFGFLPIDNSGTEWIVGASSGGFALGGFILVSLFFNKFRFENKIEKWASWLCLSFIAMNAIDAYSYTTSNVANMAHLAGFIFGGIVCLLHYLKKLNEIKRFSN